MPTAAGEGIDKAVKKELLQIAEQSFKNGFRKQSLSLRDNPDQELSPFSKERSQFAYTAEVLKVAAQFGDKTARQPELEATIIYLYILYIRNKWAPDELPAKVQAFKPYFEINEIQTAYQALDNGRYLQQSIA